jgi:hypothetical protein
MNVRVASSKNLNEMGIVASSKNPNEWVSLHQAKIQTNSCGGFYPLFDKLVFACPEDRATLASDLSAAAGGRPMRGRS